MFAGAGDWHEAAAGAGAGAAGPPEADEGVEQKGCTDAMQFPRTVDEITPEWLTLVLRESGTIKEKRE